MQTIVSYCGPRVDVVDAETGEPTGEQTTPEGAPIIEGQVALTEVQMTDLEGARQAAASAPPPPPSATLVASGVFTVTDGWLEGVGALAGIGMAFALDVGTYWILFNEPQLDLAYAAPASASEGQINVKRFLEYIEITVKDVSGELIDPSEFSITIMRAL